MSNFPHRQSLDGVTAASWQNSVFTKDRTDLPYPSPLESAIRQIFERIAAPSRRLAP